ncbi:MAG: hypothetical protein ACT4OM_09470 [Actinomycetota bacterium]
MDHIDDLLTEADPMRKATVSPLGPGVAHILKEMTVQESTVQESEGIVYRPRRRRARTIAAILAAAIAIPAAAAAIYGGIHTGIFAGSDETEQVPGEELLDLADPAIVAVVREEAARVPLPPGESFDPVVARYPRPEATFGQRGVIVVEVQSYAQCRWYAHWLAADASTRRRYQSVIEQFPSWDFVQHFAAGDSGPELLSDTVAQVVRGEQTLVSEFLAANC